MQSTVDLGDVDGPEPAVKQSAQARTRSLASASKRRKLDDLAVKLCGNTR